MSKLEKLVSQQHNVAGSTITNIRVTSKDKKALIDPRDVKQLVKELNKKVSKDSDNYKILVRIWGITGPPKSFNVNDMGEIQKFVGSDEYFNGKVKDVTKFLKYGRVDLCVEAWK